MNAEWDRWLEGALAVAATLGLMWKTMRVVYKIEKALPTLLGIADEFRENGGSSLKDNILALSTELNNHSRDDEVRFAKLEQLLLGIGHPKQAV